MKLPRVVDSHGEFIIPDPGVYQMEFAAYGEPQPSRFDDGKLRIPLTFRICDGDEFDGAEIRQWYGWTMHPQSRLYPVIKALLGRDPEEDEEIDLEDLIGRRIMGTVEIVEKPSTNGNGTARFANLVAAAPVRRKAKGGAPAPANSLSEAKRRRAEEFEADDDTWDDEE